MTGVDGDPCLGCSVARAGRRGAFCLSQPSRDLAHLRSSSASAKERTSLRSAPGPDTGLGPTHTSRNPRRSAVARDGDCVGPNDGGIDGHPLKVRVLHDGMEEPVDMVCSQPSIVPCLDRVDVAVALWQVAPASAGTGHPKQRVEELPPVRARAPLAPASTGYQLAKPLPLAVCQILARHQRPLTEASTMRAIRLIGRSCLASLQPCQRG